MTRLIRVEGNLATVYEENILQQAPLADVLPLIENRPPFSMFHPRSALFTYWNEQNPAARKLTYLCELPPGIRSIVKSGRRYRLAIPWTYFVFGFQAAAPPLNARSIDGQQWSLVDYFCFHARDRVEDERSRLFTAFLPNVYEDGRICFGSTGVNPNQRMTDRIDELVNTWYLTEFNNDVHGSRQHPLPFNGDLPNGWRLWVDATAAHGLSAYQQFPEWDITDGSEGISSWTVREVLTASHEDGDGIVTRQAHNRITPDRPLMGMVTEAIPEIQMPFTIGRAAEWARTLDPTALYRIRTAIENVVTDDPAAMQAPEPIATTNTNPEDDGGEPI